MSERSKKEEDTKGESTDEMEAGMKKCPFCAEEIKPEAIVCKHCGRDLNRPHGTGSKSGEKNRVVAGVFGILLGGLGIHKFYLGQIGWGIVYLLLCWTFIPALVGLIEGIIYLTMSDEAFSQKYQ